jgi:hypothetical protein
MGAHMGKKPQKGKFVSYLRVSTQKQGARALMRRGIPAPRGGEQWRESQISRLLTRVA